MRATYESWNGQTYPWPPPEGWHEAPDGRWWAPDSSPDDPDLALDEQLAPSSPAAAVIDTANTPADGGSTSADGDRSGAELGALPNASAGLWQPDDLPLWKRPQMMVAAGTGALLVVISAVIALIGTTSDRTEADNSAQTTAPTEQSTTGSEAADDIGENATGTVQANETTAPIATTTTEAAADAMTSAPPDSSSDQTSSTSSEASSATETTVNETTLNETTVNEGTGTPVGSPVTIGPADAAKANELRAYLSENGLSGELINDVDLVEFANTFCIFAITADSRAQYEASRDEAIVDSSSELTQEELVVAVDGAVQTFCPEDARRLGLIS